nr:f-box/kelch-repeat protein [Quercus suber]
MSQSKMSNSGSKWRWGRRWRSCRLRCVQKSWSTLVQNPTFIAKHLRHHQTKTKNPSILVEGMDKEGNFKYLLQSHPDEGGGVRIVDFKGDSMEATMALSYGIQLSEKVVRVVEHRKKSVENSITRYRSYFFVYSLRADSWTQIFGTPVQHNNIKLHSRCDEIFFNGFHHWIGSLNSEPGDSYDHHIIMSFDMSHEVFQIIRFPDMFFPNKTLAVFNDCLACIVYGINEYIDIWVMREYGVEDSWTKQLVVGHLLGIQRPLQILGNEEILLVDEKKTLVLYNIGSQEMKILQRTGYPKIFMPTQAFGYVESLVSFTGGDVFES